MTDRKSLSIFVSYAREDRTLASAVVTALQAVFSLAPVTIESDLNFVEGDDFRDAINDKLDAAAALIVLYTARSKPSHSYTGFEVGFFTNSIRKTPDVIPGVRRFILPVCIGAESPDTLESIHGIRVDPQYVFPPPDPNNPVATLTSDPAKRLLQRIDTLVRAAAQIPIAAKDLDLVAAGLSASIYSYLANQIADETFPERKIIITSTTRPPIDNDGADLSHSKITLLGKSFEVFGISTPRNPPHDILPTEYSWDDFLSKISKDHVGIWRVGIKSLVAAVLRGSGENYLVVTTTSGNRSFRLFVSRIVMFAQSKD
jgi:TIR domain